MNNEQKEQIREALIRYTKQFPTQKTAALSLEDVSPYTLSLIKNYKWQKINETMWTTIARQVGFYCSTERPRQMPKPEWKKADTGCYLLLRILFGDAQRYNMAYGVAIQTGLGKTFAATTYAKENPNACYIACNEKMNRKSFLETILSKLGQEPTGTAAVLTEQLVATVEEQDEPLIILDDAHLLKDRVLHFVIQLYKRLINHCGITILGNDTLRTRIIEGARLCKEHHNEIYNTIGRRFVTLGQSGPKDIELVCRANGINNEASIYEIKSASMGNLHNAAAFIKQIQAKETNRQELVNG